MSALPSVYIPEAHTSDSACATVTGTFTRLPSIYLTINQADNGCVKQHLVQGTSCTFVIEAAEGWKVNAVTFNGEDVTKQLGKDNTYITPELVEDATLNISYEKIDDAIESTRTGAVRVRGHEGIIRVDGAEQGNAITIYTTDGAMVATLSADAATTEIAVPTGQVYIVHIGDKVVKIGI